MREDLLASINRPSTSYTVRTTGQPAERVKTDRQARQIDRQAGWQTKRHTDGQTGASLDVG